MAKKLNQQDLLKLSSINTPPTDSVAFAAKSDGLYQKIGTVESKLSTTAELLDRVKTAVPKEAKFTDTIVDISGKVDKVTGKGLSTNDYTSAEKVKLNKIEEGANKYTHPASHSISFITGLQGALNSKATPTDISTAIDDIEIGGRNLIKGTSDEIVELTLNTWGTWTHENSAITLSEFGIESGDYITASVYLNCENQGSGSRISLRMNNIRVADGNIIEDGGKGISRITYQVESSQTEAVIQINGVPYGSTGGHITKYKILKLEKGNKATDWSPAPEDQIADWNSTSGFDYIKNKPTKLSQFIDNISVGSHIANKVNPHAVTTAQIGAVDLTTNQSIGGVKTFTGNVTAPSFIGNASSASAVSTSAENTGTTSRYILFANSASGNQALKTDSGLKYVPSTNTITATLAGNASTATTLATTRAINGTNFNGSAAITTANWGTARNIGVVNSDGTGTAVTTSVNGSANVNLKLPATIKAALTGNASSATKVNNKLTLKFDTGTAENTSLYTYDGSAAKTIDIKAGSNVSFTKAGSSVTINSTNTKYVVATTEVNGLMSSGDKTKLDGIATGANKTTLSTSTSSTSTTTAATSSAVRLAYNRGSTGITDAATAQSKADSAYTLASGKEDKFTKNGAFNKNFGTAKETVAQGNDSRINNGQTAFGWGNHALKGYATETYVDNIEIGGRNLNIASNIIDGEHFDQSTGVISNEYPTLSRTPYIEVEPNVKYTVNSRYGLFQNLRVVFFDEDKNFTRGFVYGSETSMKRMYTTLSNEKYITLSGNNNNDVKHPKNYGIYRGNVGATDWTPAPEDQVSDWGTTDVTSFSYIKNKPTTLAGYGITDAVTLNTAQTITGTKTFNTDIILGINRSIRGGDTYSGVSNVDNLLWTFGSRRAGSVANIRSEKVGIGTDSPLYKLDVRGTGRFTGNVTASAGVNTPKVDFGNGFTIEPSGTELVFKYNGVTKQRLLSDGSIVAVGEITAITE